MIERSVGVDFLGYVVFDLEIGVLDLPGYVLCVKKKIKNNFCLNKS